MMEQRLRIPLVSRLICKYLWHSWKGLLNEHGAFKYLVCTRCGDRYDLTERHYVGRRL